MVRPDGGRDKAGREKFRRQLHSISCRFFRVIVQQGVQKIRYPRNAVIFKSDPAGHQTAAVHIHRAVHNALPNKLAAVPKGYVVIVQLHCIDLQHLSRIIDPGLSVSFEQPMIIASFPGIHLCLLQGHVIFLQSPIDVVIKTAICRRCQCRIFKMLRYHFIIYGLYRQLFAAVQELGKILIIN